MTEWFTAKKYPERIVFKDAGKHTWVSYYRTLDKVIIDTDLTKLDFPNQGQENTAHTWRK